MLTHTNGNYTVLDAETTTFNKGHPFDPRNRLISYAYRNTNNPIIFHYYTDPGFKNIAQSYMGGSVVGFNVKFDWHWLPISDSAPIWDCQLAEHIYTGQKAQFISLSECLDRYGLETKLDIVKDYWEAGVQTDEIPVNILQEYNEWDVQQTEKLFLVQQELLDDKQKNLVYLLGEDLKVLAHIERAGILFDKEGAAKALNEYKETVRSLEKQLAAFLPVIQHGVFNWDSGDHLSCFLYGGELKFDYTTSELSTYKTGVKKGQEYTRNHWHVESVVFPGYFKPLEGSEIKKTKDKVDIQTRYYQTDAPTLASLKGGGKEGKNILSLLASRSEIQKLVEMLESLFKQFTEKQWENNLIHGTYNQNVAVTGRLSSSAPNMQNVPPEIEQFFISRYID